MCKYIIDISKINRAVEAFQQDAVTRYGDTRIIVKEIVLTFISEYELPLTLVGATKITHSGFIRELIAKQFHVMAITYHCLYRDILSILGNRCSACMDFSTTSNKLILRNVGAVC